jgi:hypothetical protein
MSATLCFLPDGMVKGLYTEVINLQALGQLKVERATSIEFDHTWQVWRVFDPEGQMLYCSPSRKVCLEWEQKHLTWVLKQS